MNTDIDGMGTDRDRKLDLSRGPIPGVPIPLSGFRRDREKSAGRSSDIVVRALDPEYHRIKIHLIVDWRTP